ncbi:MAG TPA: hypothetical protein VJ898_10880 [Natrialbaceae archaeon]|nr:hypothetical protein [Natrialbaceae archaeon]
MDGRPIDYLIGGQWGQRVVVLGAVAVYAVLLVVDPTAARESAVRGLTTFGQLFTLIVASLLLASAIGTVLPREAITSRLGGTADAPHVVGAGILAGLFPGGPYAVYPIIESVSDRGAGYPAVLTMLLGYGLIGAGRIAFGLVFFGPAVVGIRLVLALVGTVVVGVATVGLAAALR